MCLLAHACTALAQAPPAGAPPVENTRTLPMPLPMPKGVPQDATGRPAIPPFAPGQVRLPRLPGVPAPLGGAPRPSPEVIQEYKKFVTEVATVPEVTLDLVVNRPRLLKFEDIPKRIQVADENVATYALLEAKELSVLGREVGSTVLNLWFTDPNDKTKTKVLSYLIRVFPDPEARERLERVFKALEAEINRIFCDSKICLTLAGDKMVVSGQAKDINDATQILRIVRANAAPDRSARIPVDALTLDPAVGPDGLTPQALERYLLSGYPQVINMIKIPGEQQVMLQVTVAEVDRTAARSIGLNFNIFNQQGALVFRNSTGNIFNPFNTVAGAGINNGIGGVGFGSLANLPVALDNGQIQLAINALRELSYARSLAEPTLVTMNGQTASFQAGGQFPVPYVTGYANVGLQGVGYLPVGVQLSFTPYVTDRDRIRLNIAAEVSARDLNIPTTFVNGTAVPNLTTRNFQTMVELREGQTLAVAGLMQNQLGAQGTRVPLFGDLPVVGRLFAYDRIAAREQELVILITPQLVHPMEHKQVPPLPGSDIFEPGDVEFYLCARLESRRGYDYRSPVMTDIQRMCSYRRCEQNFIQGPHGFSGPAGGPPVLPQVAPAAKGATPEASKAAPSSSALSLPVPRLTPRPPPSPAGAGSAAAPAYGLQPVGTTGSPYGTPGPALPDFETPILIAPFADEAKAERAPDLGLQTPPTKGQEMGPQQVPLEDLIPQSPPQPQPRQE